MKWLALAAIFGVIAGWLMVTLAAVVSAICLFIVGAIHVTVDRWLERLAERLPDDR